MGLKKESLWSSSSNVVTELAPRVPASPAESPQRVPWLTPGTVRQGETFSLWPLPGPLSLCAFHLDLSLPTHQLQTSSTQLSILRLGLQVSSLSPTGPKAGAQDLAMCEHQTVGPGGISLRAPYSPGRSRTPNRDVHSIPILKVEMWYDFLGFKSPASAH